MQVACVVNDVKTGKSYQKQVDNTSFSGRNIGDTLPGTALGLVGYELQITGGSDTAGFPLKKELEGGGRKKLLLKKGDTGIRDVRPGDVVRKTVRGHAMTDFVAQINLKISKYGTKSVEELLGVQPKEGAAQEPAAEKKEEKTEKK